MHYHKKRVKAISKSITTVLMCIAFPSLVAYASMRPGYSEAVGTAPKRLAEVPANLESASFDPAGNGPVLYLSKSEINDIKSKVQKNEEPWASAHRALIRDAENALKMKPRSVVDNGGPAAANFDRHSYGEDKTYDGDGIIRSKSNKEDSKALYAMSGAIQDLGLAYAYTGDDRYAQKAIDLLYHWCVDPNTFMRPIAHNFSPHTPGGPAHGAISVYNALPWMAFGASFVLGHPYWSSKGSNAEAKVLQWMADMNRSAVERGEKSNNNFYTRYIETRAALSALLGDRAGLNEAINLWKEHIRFSVKPNGRLHRESGRTKGIDYSVYGLEPFAKVAVLARNYGVDLWHWEDGQGGAPLRRAYDFLLPYVLDPHMPRKWIADGYKQITGVDTELLGQVFHMAYAAYGDENYAQVVRKLNRGHRVALLFGRIGDLIGGSGEYEDEDWTSDDDVGGGIPDDNPGWDGENEYEDEYDDEYEDGGSGDEGSGDDGSVGGDTQDGGGNEGPGDNGDDWSGDDGSVGGDIQDDNGGEEQGNGNDEGGQEADPDSSVGHQDEVLYLSPLADAYVRDGAYSNRNAGNMKGLTVKTSTEGFTRVVFLKFDLASLPLSTRKAILELHPIGVGNPGQVHELALVEDDTWEEGTITWNNKPSTSKVLASWVPVQGEPVRIDITTAVIEALSTDRILSLQIHAPQEGDGASWVHYGSRERSENNPRLEAIVNESSGTTTTTTDSDKSDPSNTGGDQEGPTEFTLDQNYPNPFNPTTTIQYRLPQAATVRLAIYNVAGQLVKVLVNGQQEAGQYRVEWDGRDQAGHSVASGLYLYRIEAGSFTDHRTMMLIK